MYMRLVARRVQVCPYKEKWTPQIFGKRKLFSKQAWQHKIAKPEMFEKLQMNLTIL